MPEINEWQNWLNDMKYVAQPFGMKVVKMI